VVLKFLSARFFPPAVHCFVVTMITHVWFLLLVGLFVECMLSFSGVIRKKMRNDDSVSCMFGESVDFLCGDD